MHRTDARDHVKLVDGPTGTRSKALPGLEEVTLFNGPVVLASPQLYLLEVLRDSTDASGSGARVSCYCSPRPFSSQSR